MTIDQLSNLIKDPNIFGYLIVRPFGLILLSLYNFVHNYGLAVILFALIVKLCCVPLAIKGKKSMLAMTALNAEMQQLQKKYANNRVKLIEEMQKEQKLMISALAYIRGRSLSDVYFIVDEAQNLTPHEVKTIITRAGEGTKMVFTGDIDQIDSPYLDKKSNGLSHLFDKMQGQDIFAHVHLEKGERSKLADLASDLL